MINLNLLPEKEKSNLNLDSWRRLILVFGSAFLVGLGFFSSILVSANIYLLNNLEKSSALLNLHRQLPPGREIAEIEEKLNMANQKLNQVAEIRKRISSKSYIFPEVASMLPQNVSLISLSVKSGGLVELVGFARERAGLLLLKESLGKNENISDLNFPLANLLKEKDIEFSLSFKIKQ